MTDEARRAQMERLLLELDALRRELELADRGERGRLTSEIQAKRRRRDALEGLVGVQLDALLGARRGADAIDRLTAIAATIGLGGPELRELLRISPVEVWWWQRDGLPDQRLRQLRNVECVAQMLAERLKPGRVIDAMRRPAQGLGGQSMVDLLAAGRYAELRAAVAEFDRLWGSGSE